MPSRLEMLQTRQDAYIAAEAAILGGAQSYAIGSRNLTRANLMEVRAAISDLEMQIASEKNRANGGRIRTIGVIPRDI